MQALDLLQRFRTGAVGDVLELRPGERLPEDMA
jgi:hypothetical protein